MIHFIDLESFTDVPEQSHVEKASQVLLKFPQTVQNYVVSRSIHGQERIVPKSEAQGVEQIQNALPVRGAEISRLDRVDRIECHPERHRLSVAKPVTGQRLQFVRRPVAEVERPG